MPMAAPKNFLDLADEALLKAHLDAAEGAHTDALNTTAPGRAMLAADPDRRAALAARALALWAKWWPKNVGRVASDLLRASGKDWTAARLVKAVEAASTLDRNQSAFGGFDMFPHRPLISAVEKAAAREPIPSDL